MKIDKFNLSAQSLFYMPIALPKWFVLTAAPLSKEDALDDDELTLFYLLNGLPFLMDASAATAFSKEQLEIILQIDLSNEKFFESWLEKIVKVKNKRFKAKYQFKEMFIDNYFDVSDYDEESKLFIFRVNHTAMKD